jgi:hypothetical protein
VLADTKAQWLREVAKTDILVFNLQGKAVILSP